eukprot:4454226-Amphidinium_carterae.1
MLVDLTSGALLTPLQQLVGTFGAADFAKELQFSHRQPIKDGAQKEQNDVLCHSLLTLLCNSLGECAPTALSYCHEPPFCFFGLLHSSPDMRAKMLDYLRSLWSQLLGFEQSMRDIDTEMVHFRRDLKWPVNQFVHEVFETLDCHNWTPPEQLLRLLRNAAQGWAATLIVENSMREGRKSELQPSGSAGILRTWHGLHTSDGLAPQYNRAGMQHGDSARAKRTITDDCSLPDDIVDNILSSRPEYPTLSATANRDAALRTLAFHKLSGDFAKLQRAYLSKLFQPGTLAHQSGEKGYAHVVLRSTTHGVLTVRISLSELKADASILPRLASNTTQMTLLPVTDLAGWKILPFECRGPGHPKWFGAKGSEGMVLALSGKKGVPVLEYAVRSGCKGMTAPLLR